MNTKEMRDSMDKAKLCAIEFLARSSDGDAEGAALAVMGCAALLGQILEGIIEEREAQG